MQIGPYRVVSELGRGGMATVYLARDAAGEAVALKVLHDTTPRNSHVRQRFANEVQALSRLRHPHLVALRGAGDHRGSPWLALDYVAGETLGERLVAGPLPIWEAIRVTQQIASALGYLHSCGVLHRDLTPGNVLFRGSEALLSDLGLALDADLEASRLTTTGVFLGTPGYWAPEQARGDKEQFGPPTDVYGLGALLYACLTGHPPVQASTLQEHLARVNYGKRTPPRVHRREVPVWLSDLCMRCLEHDPARRPQSADDVARALLLAEAAAPTQHRRWAWVLGSTVVSGLAAAGVWAATLVGGPAQQLAPGHSNPPGAQPDPPTDAPVTEARLLKLLERAGTELEAGNFVASLALADHALEIDVQHPEPHAARGRALGCMGQLKEALAAGEHSLSLRPTAAAYELLAGTHLQLQQLNEASRYCEAGIRYAPRSALLHRVRGLLNRQLGRRVEAVADLSRAAELEPSNPKLHFDLGSLLYDLERFDDAVKAYDRSLRLDSSYAPSRVNRAEALVALERHAEAVEECDRLLSLGESQPQALAFRGLARLGLGDLQAGYDDVQRSLELEPTNGALLYQRGVALARHGLNPEALADFERAGQLLPGSDLIRRARAKLLAQLGHHQEAMQEFERLPPESLNDALVLIGRAQALCGLGRAEQALAELDEGLARAPGDLALRVQRSEVLSAQGQIEAALTELDTILQADPSHLQAIRSQVELLAALKRYPEALAACESLLRVLPDDARALSGRGCLLGLLGRPAEGVNALSRALAQQPDHVLWLQQRAELNAKLGHHAEAVRDLDRALGLGLPPERAAEVRRLRDVSAARVQQ